MSTDKMVMSMILESNTADTTCVNASISKTNMNNELTDQEQRTIREFLDKAEDIAMSATSVDVDYNVTEDSSDHSCENEQQCEYNPFNPIAVDDAIVQEIIANDDRLHREVDEFMNMYSISIDGEEEFDFDTFDYSTIMGSNE